MEAQSILWLAIDCPAFADVERVRSLMWAGYRSVRGMCARRSLARAPGMLSDRVVEGRGWTATAAVARAASVRAPRLSCATQPSWLPFAAMAVP